MPDYPDDEAIDLDDNGDPITVSEDDRINGRCSRHRPRRSR